MEYVLVGVGGFAGANARYVLSRVLVGLLGDQFPFATLIVNVSGSLMVGVVLGLLAEREVTNPVWRQLLVVGFLGGYTTFSAYTFEALALVEAGTVLRAMWYIMSSNIVGLAAAYSGLLLVRTMAR